MVYWYLIGPTKRFMLAGEGGETEGRRQKAEDRRQKFRSSGAGTSDGDVRRSGDIGRGRPRYNEKPRSLVAFLSKAGYWDHLQARWLNPGPAGQYV